MKNNVFYNIRTLFNVDACVTCNLIVQWDLDLGCLVVFTVKCQYGRFANLCK